jgi:UDP-glucuronate 4-epimerase
MTWSPGWSQRWTAPPPHALFNLGNHRAEALEHVIDTIEAACGTPAIRQLEPMQPGDVPATYADLTESRRDLDFHPTTTIREGLPRFVEWYRQQGRTIDPRL